MQSELPNLIAAILANPDDDALRLACADWFEEQGDEASVARAEFIRAQIARSAPKVLATTNSSAASCAY